MPARLGHLRLDVADLDRQTEFYTHALGLTVRERATDAESHSLDPKSVTKRSAALLL